MPVYHVRSGVGVMINPTPLSRPEYEETKHIINSVHDEFAESVSDKLKTPILIISIGVLDSVVNGMQAIKY